MKRGRQWNPSGEGQHLRLGPRNAISEEIIGD